MSQPLRELDCGGEAETRVLPVAGFPPISGVEWFSVNRDVTGAVVSIHGEIGIGNQTAEDLLEAVGPEGDVRFIIRSFGGDTDIALKIFYSLKDRVTVATVYECFSAAMIFACAAKTIRIQAGARMMVHRARRAVFGDQDQLALAIKHIQKCNQAYFKVLSRRCPNAVEWNDGKDHYFTASEALSAGLVDEIFELPPVAFDKIGEPASAQEPGPTSDEQLFMNFFHAFGPVIVRNRHLFARSCGAWAFHNSTEA